MVAAADQTRSIAAEHVCWAACLSRLVDQTEGSLKRWKSTIVYAILWCTKYLCVFCALSNPGWKSRRRRRRENICFPARFGSPILFCHLDSKVYFRKNSGIGSLDFWWKKDFLNSAEARWLSSYRQEVKTHFFREYRDSESYTWSFGLFGRDYICIEVYNPQQQIIWNILIAAYH